MKIVRTTLYPNQEVISVGGDYQNIPHLCGNYNEVSGAVLAEADENTIFEIALFPRGPMNQVHREDWKVYER